MDRRSRYIDEGKIFQLAKQRQIGMKVVGKSRESSLAGIDVRKGDHRRRGWCRQHAIKEQGELIHEVTQRGFAVRTAFIGFGGKNVLRKSHCVAEVGDLFRFGFKILVVAVGEDEIEQEKTCADELDGMPAAVAQVFFADIAIEGL